MKKVLFSGSFDPFTLGHAAIVERGLTMFEEVVIAIGQHPLKKNYFSAQERKNQIETVYRAQARVQVSLYEGLTADFAKENQIEALLRGVRTITDFEYERNLAEINKKLFNLETILLISEAEYSHISSSMVRELLLLGCDVSSFVPFTI